MSLLWSEHINAVSHQFLTKHVLIHIREDESENSTAPKYSVVSLLNVEAWVCYTQKVGFLIAVVLCFPGKEGFDQLACFH